MRKLGDVYAKKHIDTQAATLAKVQGVTYGNKLKDLEAEALVVTPFNTLAEVEENNLATHFKK